MSIDTASGAEPGAEPSAGPSAGPGAGPGVGAGVGAGEGPRKDPGPGGWLLEQRGNFVVGRCDECGFTTSARRARFSVESDMLAHGSDCGGH